MTPAERNELKDKMTTGFSFSEVKDLCFALGIDPDSVPGETKPDKIRELIMMCERRGRVDELVAAVNAQRAQNASAQTGGSGQARAPSSQNKKITILFLAANPKDTPQLRLDEEVRTIDERLRQAQNRDKFDLKQQWAVRASDILDAMLRYKPDIVHFSGHGSPDGNLIFENSSGQPQPVTPEAIGALFAARKGVRCVVMNACYSDTHADAITKSVDCVMGMVKDVKDITAISFASGLYRTLGDGLSVQEAFDAATVSIMLEGGIDPGNEEKIPHLRTRKGVDANDVKFG